MCVWFVLLLLLLVVCVRALFVVFDLVGYVMVVAGSCVVWCCVCGCLLMCVVVRLRLLFVCWLFACPRLLVVCFVSVVVCRALLILVGCVSELLILCCDRGAVRSYAGVC